jgi:hypothetical protein
MGSTIRLQTHSVEVLAWPVETEGGARAIGGPPSFRPNRR